MTVDEIQIRELVEAWMAASKAGDLPAMLALMTDDVIFMTPGQPPFGKKEFAANAARMRDVKMDGRADVQEIEVIGNRAFLRNHLQITLTQPGQAPKRMAGYTMGVLRKDADGHWRLARDANLVMPAAG
jgi:uncharacterized protein (TIGR02246 family)